MSQKKIKQKRKLQKQKNSFSGFEMLEINQVLNNTSIAGEVYPQTQKEYYGNLAVFLGEHNPEPASMWIYTGVTAKEILSSHPIVNSMTDNQAIIYFTNFNNPPKITDILALKNHKDFICPFYGPIENFEEAIKYCFEKMNMKSVLIRSEDKLFQKYSSIEINLDLNKEMQITYKSTPVFGGPMFEKIK